MVLSFQIKTHHPELYKECMAELKEITQDLPDGAKSEDGVKNGRKSTK